MKKEMQRRRAEKTEEAPETTGNPATGTQKAERITVRYPFDRSGTGIFRTPTIMERQMSKMPTAGGGGASSVGQQRGGRNSVIADKQQRTRVVEKRRSITDRMPGIVVPIVPQRVQKRRQFVKNVLHSKAFNTVIITVSLWSLFSSDIRISSTTKATDVVFDSITIVICALFFGDLGGAGETHYLSA